MSEVRKTNQRHQDHGRHQAETRSTRENLQGEEEVNCPVCHKPVDEGFRKKYHAKCSNIAQFRWREKRRKHKGQERIEGPNYFKLIPAYCKDLTLALVSAEGRDANTATCIIAPGVKKA